MTTLTFLLCTWKLFCILKATAAITATLFDV